MRLILAGFIFSCSLLAQQSVDNSISGVVLNAQTGEPLKYALVTLVGFPPADPSGQVKPEPPLRKTLLTGVAGEFQFNGLAKMNYSLKAEKPGFSAQSPDNPAGNHQLDLAASVSGVQLKLSPLGVIEGKVLDQNDEPVRAVNIMALQVRVNDGLRDTSAPRSVATDDRGVYRLWNLAPGRYYIKAAGRSGGTYRYVEDAAPSYSSWQGFTPVYAGGGRTLDSATPIQIDPGSKASADFRLNMEPAFRIRGTLANVPTEDVTFELVQDDEDVSASRASLNKSSGRFEVQDVTSGAYLLRVTQKGKMRGEALVSVNNGDANGVSITLAPPVPVEGVTRVVGAPFTVKQMPGFDHLIAMARADPDYTDVDPNQTIDTTCNASLEGRGGSSIAQSPGSRRRMGQATTNQEKGAFTVGDFLPGAYRVRVQCDGGYPTSVFSGGVDLLANPNLVIQAGVPPAPIEIQVKPGGGVLDGVFAVSPMPQNPGVLLVPAFGNSAGPVMIQVFSAPGTQENANFGQPFLAPGDYSVYAFSDWQQVEYRNPAFLQTLTGGVSLHIEDGKEQRLTVTTVVK